MAEGRGGTGRARMGPKQDGDWQETSIPEDTSTAHETASHADRCPSLGVGWVRKSHRSLGKMRSQGKQNPDNRS